MPVVSMTGFARWKGTHDEARLVWELRSVNGKTLDLKFRLPPGFDGLEPDLKRRAGTRLARGNIQASLQVVRDAVGTDLVINEKLLAQLVAVADELVRAGHAASPTADGLLALRGVVDPRDPGAAAPDDDLRAVAAAGFDSALDELVASRAAEGAEIAAVLSRRLDEFASLIERADADPSRNAETIAERLRKQVEALMATGAGLDPARLAQEAALLATRADIREELDRLGAHLGAARALIAADGAAGRRLDFLAQEFNRESNTICSKSNAASLTAIGLELKVAVDQFREQVQNIE